MSDSQHPRTFDPIPLSPLQRGMLFHHLSGAHGGVDIQQIICALPERVDETLLADAWRGITQRYPMLRSYLSWEVEAEPSIRIADAVRPSIALHGFELLAPDRRAEKLEAFLRTDRKRSFKLDEAPLFRISLFDFGEEGHRFVLTFHHALMDGRSTATILREVMGLYAGLASGSVPELEVHAPWRPRAQGARAAEVEQFWRDRLAGFGESTPLPGDGTGDTSLAEETERYAEAAARLDAEAKDRLEAAARRHDLSIGTAVQAAWALLLGRYADVDDVVFGATLAGRRGPGAEDAIGVLINTVPVRIRIEDDVTVARWLGRLRRSQRAIRSFQDVSLVDCAGWSEVAPGRPLFESLLIFDRCDMSEHLRRMDPAWADRSVRVLERTGYPLTVSAVTEPEVAVRLTYDRSRISDTGAQRIVEQLLLVLERMASNPNDTVGEVSILLPSEADALLGAWNDTARNVDWPETVWEQIEAQVRRTPEATALRSGSTSLTYAELEGRVEGLARALATEGVARGSTVGILMKRSIELVVGMLATLRIGAAYLAIDPTQPSERIGFMLADAGAPLLLADVHHAALVSERDWSGSVLDPSTVDAVTEVGARAPQDAPEPHDLAYVMYTSGSTGRPKGVMIEHRNVTNFFAGMDERVDHDPPGIWLALTSASFDISVLELLWTLARGFEVVIWREATGRHAGAASRPMDMSLFFFAGSEGGEEAEDRFRLITRASRFADERGFCAVWTPERHFHAFGGLSPNAAVMASALATITERVELRSGSVVLPLHHPVRVAEEWGLVDNLSGGRVGLGVASGWFPNDWVLAVGESEYEDRNDLTFERLELIRRLWRGETCVFPRRDGTPVDVRTFPRPIQPEVPIWVTAAVNPATFARAGEVGAHVLTHLLGQTIDDLEPKIAAYREAWETAGHPGRGIMTVMLHTLVGESDEAVLELAREPLKNYLATSVDLVSDHLAAVLLFKDVPDIDLEQADPATLNEVLEYSFQRYANGSSLLGSPDTCLAVIDRLKQVDVDEVACFVDFGVDEDVVLASLERLDEVRERANAGSLTPREADSIPDLIRRHGITHLQCTPSHARLLVHDPESRHALRGLEVMLVGGEAMPLGLARALAETVRGRVLNMYGPTETTIWSSTDEVVGEPAAISIGRPIANTRFYVLDSALRPVPIGAAGELFVTGAGVARGYVNLPDLTRERFLTNPFDGDCHPRLYRTGDRVRYHEDGRLEFLGRADNQVKIRGHRVELGEVEAALERHFHVARAAVRPRRTDGQVAALVAYVVPSSAGLAPKPEVLRSWLRGALPEPMIPSSILVVRDLPLTPSGKLDRGRLPEPRGALAETVDQEPLSPFEMRVARIWADVIGVEDVRAEDDFFELGGNSLSTIQISLRIRDEFGVEIPLATFSRVSTVAAVAALIEDRVVSEADPATLDEVLAELDALSDGETRSLLAGDPGD